MSALTIAKALKGRRTGATWMVHCPAHADRTPSLAIRDGDAGAVLVHCHAGCPQPSVIAALKSLGLWHDVARVGRTSAGRKARRITEHLELDDYRRIETALRLWKEAEPSPGTLVEGYLAGRGIHLRPPAVLRFHPGLKHPTGGVWPVMVALVTAGVDGTPIGIHRTYLARDGSGKAPVQPAKMMLGRCRGGAIRLAHFDSALFVGEGIESCLSAMQAIRRPTWAALSTSGLMGLNLPASIIEVIVLADGDEAGERAAQDCARRWRREGRSVRIARPPRGSDFNDVLVGCSTPQLGPAT